MTNYERGAWTSASAAETAAAAAVDAAADAGSDDDGDVDGCIARDWRRQRKDRENVDSADDSRPTCATASGVERRHLHRVQKTSHRPAGAARRYAPPPPADGSSTRGGPTSVRGRFRSPHVSGGRPAAGSQLAPPCSEHAIA